MQQAAASCDVTLLDRVVRPPWRPAVPRRARSAEADPCAWSARRPTAERGTRAPLPEAEARLHRFEARGA